MKSQKKYVNNFSPIAALPGIFQQITPKKTLQTFWPNYRPFIVIGHKGSVFLAEMFSE